jgi:hypothetical protein
VTGDVVALAETPVGSLGGKIFYNAELQPLIGYGLSSAANFQAKTVLAAIEDAFTARSEPLTQLSPWPYPNRAAAVFRHDHTLHTNFVELEGVGRTPPVSGEYYIQPDSPEGGVFLGSLPPYTAVRSLQNLGAVIGAHTIKHQALDALSQQEAKRELCKTRAEILPKVNPGTVIDNFVSPGGLAIRPSSMRALAEYLCPPPETAHGVFLTSGDQSFGPFPHFSVDMEQENAASIAVLQIPTGGSLEHSIGNNAFRDAMVDVAYATGGLINVYDHPFVPGAYERYDAHLADVLALPNVWETTANKIRELHLVRASRTLTVTRSAVDNVVTIGVTIGRLGQAPFPADPNLAISVRLPVAPTGAIVVTVDGSATSEYTVQGSRVLVKVGDATSLGIIAPQ